MREIFMDDPKINDNNIDQEHQVVIGQGSEPPSHPESPHGLYPERIRLLKDPDQHSTNQKTTQNKEKLHPVD